MGKECDFVKAVRDQDIQTVAKILAKSKSSTFDWWWCYTESAAVCYQCTKLVHCFTQPTVVIFFLNIYLHDSTHQA